MGIAQGQQILNPKSQISNLIFPSLPAWSYLALLVPLFLGVVIPPQPPGASVVNNRGLTSAASIAQGEEAVSSPEQVRDSALASVPARRDILGWLRAFGSDPDPEAFAGQAVEVVGFLP